MAQNHIIYDIEILNAKNKGEQPPKIVKNHRKKIITLDNIADK